MKKLLLFIIVCSIILIGASLTAKAQLVKIPDPLNCDGDCDLVGIIKKLTEILRTLAIPLGTVMIIIGGIQYMTAGGNEERANKAKKTLLYTVIGVAIVLAADFLVGIVQEILKSANP
jgi:hypothetical protein